MRTLPLRRPALTGWACLLVSLIASGLATLSRAETTEADRVVGRWRTEGGKGVVEIYADSTRAGQYLGRIASGESGPSAPVDEHNPDPALRSRPLLGLTFMTGFRYEGDGRYVDGRIYDPNSGNTYRGKLRLEDADTLILRGYLGVSLFGSSQTWTRVRTPAADSASAP